jgi:hypothetical protein
MITNINFIIGFLVIIYQHFVLLLQVLLSTSCSRKVSCPTATFHSHTQSVNLLLTLTFLTIYLLKLVGWIQKVLLLHKCLLLHLSLLSLLLLNLFRQFFLILIGPLFFLNFLLLFLRNLLLLMIFLTGFYLRSISCLLLLTLHILKVIYPMLGNLIRIKAISAGNNGMTGIVFWRLNAFKYWVVCLGGNLLLLKLLKLLIDVYCVRKSLHILITLKTCVCTILDSSFSCLNLLLLHIRLIQTLLNIFKIYYPPCILPSVENKCRLLILLLIYLMLIIFKLVFVGLKIINPLATVIYQLKF